MHPTDLFIVRHGPAEDEHPDHPGDDQARRLTDEGIEKVRLAAAGARALGYLPSQIWTSPLTRASQTAAIFSQAYGPQVDVVTTPALATFGANADVRTALGAATVDAVMVVGHEPNLSDLVSELCAGGFLRVAIKKSSLTHVRLRELRGALIGELVAYLPPRALRAAGGER